MTATISFEDAKNPGKQVQIALNAQTVVNPGPSPDTATILTPDGHDYCVVGSAEEVRIKIQAGAARSHESGEETQRNTAQN